MVPGRFACSRTPNTSSSCTTISARRRAREKALHAASIRRRRRSRRRPCASTRVQRLQQAGAVATSARSFWRAYWRLGRQQAAASARTSMSCPSHQPASVGRSCVLAVTSARCRIGGRRLEAAGRRARRTARGTTARRSRERVAHLVGHGAEVLADHQALVAVAFQREQAQQVVERIAHVGAVPREQPARDPEQAQQCPSRGRCAARRRAACWRAASR